MCGSNPTWPAKTLWVGSSIGRARKNGTSLMMKLFLTGLCILIASGLFALRENAKEEEATENGLPTAT